MKTKEAFVMGLGLVLVASLAACSAGSTEAADVGQQSDDVVADPTAGRGNCIVLDASRPVTLEGRLYVDETFAHPTHGPLRPFILALASSRCVAGSTGTESVTEVQLAPETGIALSPLLGKNIRIEGTAFEWHTAWHAREVVVSTKKATAVGTEPTGCIEIGAGARTTVEGTLFVDEKFAHPSHGPTRPYILALSSPRCVIGAASKSVEEVQLISSAGVDLAALVGKKLRVEGAPFQWDTAWHAREVVVTTSSAVVQP